MTARPWRVRYVARLMDTGHTTRRAYRFPTRLAARAFVAAIRATDGDAWVLTVTAPAYAPLARRRRR